MNVTDRFLHYVSFDTQSDSVSKTCPSTLKQKLMGEDLVKELLAMGLEDARMSEQGFVYATLPANCETNAPALALIAHMDTSPDCSGADIKPRIIDYQGGDVVLNEELGIVMTEAEFPNLLRHRGQHLIVTDGTTLLGADDKAGAAEIITAVEELITSNTPHGVVKIAITPDEEVNRGTESFELDTFGADYGYTVDGGVLGEVEYENFNAASGVVNVHGFNIHPGTAKDKMKNAMLIAMEFNAMLPPDEIPARTEGYEGFFHLNGMEGIVEGAKLHYIIRDHDRAHFEQRKEMFVNIGKTLNEKYGEGVVEAIVEDSYFNMRELIEPHMYIIDRAKAAMEKNGVKPITVPIRGGTDGAALTYKGMPCPNLCTCGENFHGRFEYIPVEDMECMVKILKTIITDLV